MKRKTRGPAIRLRLHTCRVARRAGKVMPLLIRTTRVAVESVRILAQVKAAKL
jgi:hypothetical protein